ncbi:hypothetical protein HPB48_012929 [Haemaphysalis longicornis]|uniref:Uncharacterized protein n=1 Tax=Haemaphysalis longicornis TaxID=44386 RepID=A0A9J6FD75_HAELO|nr:hypothetical protein HPB48_012929 [Haemaphysalis longicornis]
MLEGLENTSLLTLRRTYVTPPALSSAEVELGNASLLSPHLSPERWNKTLAAALRQAAPAVRLHIENKAFFDALFGLIDVMGESKATWLVAWYTVVLISSITNSAAIANLHSHYDKAVEAHRDVCFNMAHDAFGYAFYGPHVDALVTPNVLQDVSQMSNHIRSTMGRMAIRAGWVLEDRMASFETSDTQMLYQEVFKSSPLRLQAVFALYANMTSSLTVNWRLAMEGLQDNNVGDVRPDTSPEEWYNFARVATGSHQLTLMPYSMEIPLYHLDVPPSFKYAGLGFQIAAALSTVIFSDEAFDEGKNRRDQLVSVARCIEADQVYRQTDLGDHYGQLLQLIALKTAWRAMRSAQSSADDNSPDPTPQRVLSGLSEAQAFFVLWCYMECGAWMAHQHCNELLRHSEEFSRAFGCRKGEPMAACMVCNLVPGERSYRGDEPNLCPR